MNILRKLLLILGGLVLAVVLAFALGIFVKWLWNWLMPPIFGLPIISFWQAWGLLLLAKILFGSHQHPEVRHSHEGANRHGKLKSWLHTNRDVPETEPIEPTTA